MSPDIGVATEDIIAQQEKMAESFPNLADMAVELILKPGYAYGDEFDFGLKLVLDGIAASQAAERAGGDYQHDA